MKHQHSGNLGRNYFWFHCESYLPVGDEFLHSSDTLHNVNVGSGCLLCIGDVGVLGLFPRRLVQLGEEDTVFRDELGAGGGILGDHLPPPDCHGGEGGHPALVQVERCLRPEEPCLVRRLDHVEDVGLGEESPDVADDDDAVLGDHVPELGPGVGQEPAQGVTQSAVTQRLSTGRLIQQVTPLVVIYQTKNLQILLRYFCIIEDLQHHICSLNKVTDGWDNEC